MMINSKLRVAVIGGGVLGASTAQQLARAGTDVVLVTEGELTSNTSGRSLSWLNSAGARSETYHRLRMAGIDRYRTIAAHHPVNDWLRFDGGLAWAPPEEADQLRARHRHEVAHGYESHLLQPEETAAQVPGVDPRVIPATGAVWNPGEGWVDLPSLVQFLIKDFVEEGGRLVTHAGRSEVVVRNGAVSAVRTAGGERFEVDAAVLATGPEVPAMAADLGIAIPDRTPISMLVTTKPLPHDLTAVLNTPHVSLRPAPGGALAVDADWTSESITRSAGGGYGVPEVVVEALLAEASRVLIGHPRLKADWTGIGPKPIPGDGDPVLGRADDVAGLSLAFSHSGATLGLIAGELLAYEILEGTAHPMLADFNVRRFGLQPADR